MSWNTYNVNTEKLKEKLVESLASSSTPVAFNIMHDDINWDVTMTIMGDKILINKYSDVVVIDFNRVPSVYDLIDRIENTILKLFRNGHASLSTHNIIEDMECRYIDDDKHVWGCSLTDFFNMIIDELEVNGPKKILFDTVKSLRDKNEDWVLFLHFINGKKCINISLSDKTVSSTMTDNNNKLCFRSIWWKECANGQSMSTRLNKFIMENDSSVDMVLMTANIITNKSSDTVSNMMSRITLQDFITCIADLYVMVMNK